MSTALVPTQPATAELYRQATDVAGVCKEIVLKTAMEIQGRKYVKVEGWQSIATAHGCTASARDVERVEGGVRAIGEIRRMSDGVVIATAEGFVGEDEPTWFGGPDKAWDKINRCFKEVTREKRPDYAIRAMCQTRAISRACRTAFAHVVVLMDSNLSTTPAEEVPIGGFNDEPAKPAQTHQEPRRVTEAATAHPEPESPATASESPSEWRQVIVPKFIKQFAGERLGKMPEKDLMYWANNYEPRPWNGVISQKDIDFRAALTAAKNELNPDDVPFN
jgi:hypothetical protein